MDSIQLSDHLPGLRRYARLLTGNAWAADDLVQDTLERACRKWLLWRTGTDLRAWLFTLMHRIYLNQQRGHPGPNAWVDLDPQDLPLAATEQPTDLTLDLERGLQRLPPEQRAVLLLVTVEDMPYAEAAAVLGIPVGTVMSRLARARERLRGFMDNTAGTDAPLAPTPPAGVSPASAARPRLRRLK
ncbi:RNA polymerase sigma factor [Acidovorax lacteus]|uniref:Sigma-70 family RNA polymerase sigma factor n=1 Tax=Acidovorax lacteus TaxID=1924988 RepID=A0ABP8KWD3_9BURK